jgi:hypothetical protein
MRIIITAAIAAACAAACPITSRAEPQSAAAQPQQTPQQSQAVQGPAWYIFSVSEVPHFGYPKDTVTLIISTREGMLSTPSAIVFYPKASLPALLQTFGVATPGELVGKHVSLADADNPALVQLVDAGRSLSSIPTAP